MKSLACDRRLLFVDSDSARSDLGARFRRTRPGPELDLVECFLRAMPLHIPRGCRATAFREPRLESGFPDLVIVVWREKITHDWRSERVFLKSYDLRLMHFLHKTRRAREDELVACFGRRAIASIGRLYDAAMIRLCRLCLDPLCATLLLRYVEDHRCRSQGREMDRGSESGASEYVVRLEVLRPSSPLAVAAAAR